MGSKTHHENRADIQEIGQRLAEIRKQKRVTQIELAKRLGVTQNAVSEYENGKSRISASMLRKICDALGSSADEMLGRKSVAKQKSALPRRSLLHRVEQIERLPNRDQQALLRTIDTFLKGAGA